LRALDCRAPIASQRMDWLATADLMLSSPELA
jgi:hypothetical protein